MHTPFRLVSVAVASAAFLLVSKPSADSAEITWGEAFSITAAADIDNPEFATLVIAADFNTADGTAVGDDNTINGIPFTETPPTGAGDLFTTMVNGPAYGGGNFFTGATDDGDLDAMLDSHAYLAVAISNPVFTLSNLSIGSDYQVQLISVADARGCCAGRTYEPDDGMGNYDTGIAIARGDFGSLIGTFTADAATQDIGWRSLGEADGNSDAGLSGMVVMELSDPTDTDGDGLTDVWEELYGLNPDSDDSDGDTILDGEEDEDIDGLDNSGEQSAGTDPTNDDTDDDGYLDGVESDTGEWDSVTETGTSPTNADSDGDNLKDGVENPELAYVDENQTGSDPNIVDSDSDTLPDGVEIAIGLSPASTDTDNNGTTDDAEDADEDGSPNGAELTNGTGISDPDSDDDGLLDGVETNTMTWVSVNETGTDPLNADSDGDTIADGVENHDLSYDPGNPTTQPGTDPNVRDTDGDLARDDTELAEGTDPTDPNDTPNVPVVTIIGGLLGGDLTDPENDGIEGATIAGPPQTAGSNFDWIGITASSEEYFDGFGGGEGAFDIFDNQVGAGGTKWCCGGPPQNATVEFETPVSLTHLTITSGNDTPDRDPRDFQILGSNDGVEFTPIYTREDDTVIWTDRNQTARIDLARASAAYKFIRYEVTRTVVNHQINEIEYFGSAGALEPIRITAISYDEDTDMITLTWTSTPGRDYTIFFDTDLVGFGGDVSDDYEASDDETTTETFPNPLPGAPRVYFVVSENS